MKHWKLASIGVAAAVLFGVLFIGGIEQASAADVFNWKFQSHHTPGSLAVESVIKPFIERVEKMSGGRLKISLHYAGELVDYAEVDKALQANMIQISNTSSLFFRGAIPMGWVTAPNMPPFVTRSNDEFNELFHHRGLDDLVAEALNERGIKYLGCHSVGNTYFWSKRACCQTGNLQKVIHRKDLVFQAGTLASDVDRRLNSFRKITYTAKAKVSPFSAGTIALLFRIFS